MKTQKYIVGQTGPEFHPPPPKGKLAILIPTINGREAYLDRLLAKLSEQRSRHISFYYDVKIIILKDNREKTIGEKRNILTKMAVTEGCSHRAFIDDDDDITDDYLELNMPGVYGDYDCNSLVGIYSVNGETNPQKHIFYHSLKYTSWWEDEKGYYRNPNHLNVIKLSLIKNIKFPESNFGEDGQFSEKLHAAGVLKKEYEITKPFYYYLFRTKTNGI